MIVDAPPALVHNVVSSTAYCLRGRMANGRYVHHGAVASNRHRLGTWIRMRRPRRVFGRRTFTVGDRIGYGTELDFLTSSCASARAYGRRTVSYVVLRGR